MDLAPESLPSTSDKPESAELLDSIADFFQLVELDEITSDDPRQRERECIRHGRWEELASLLLDRSAATTEEAERCRCLMRAAQVYETDLQDTDSAFVVMLAAFQEFPSDADLATDLARMATVHNRWQDLLQECERHLGEMSSPEKRAELLVSIAHWHERDLGDPAAAEKSYERALETNPANQVAMRALVDLHSQRGNWLRAAACLVLASAKATENDKAVKLALEAAEIYRGRLRDVDSAIEQYTRVIERVPGHTVATAALAELAWVRKDWTCALPLLENMAGSATHALDESARLWQKVAWSAQMLGDWERARASYRRSYAALPTYLPTLQAWSQLAITQGWWQDVCQTVPRLLAQANERLTIAERADAYLALGKAQLALHNADSAAEALMQALQLVPNLTAARVVLAEANERIEGRGPDNAAALIAQYRKVLEGNISADERVDYLCRIAHLQRDELYDHRAALESLQQAYALRREDQDLLHEMLDIHTQNGHWSRSVEVLERLAELTQGGERARILVAMANILAYELESPREAVAAFDLALDVDPSDRRSFEHIQRILASRQDWRGLARAYRRMIKRLGNAISVDNRTWQLSLWYDLGDLCRLELDDPHAASAAYEVCVSLAPDDPKYREAWACSLEAQGPSTHRQAIKVRDHLLSLSRTPEQAAQQIRALGNLHRNQGRYDRLFCACGALTVLGEADPRERSYYEKNALPSVPMARGGLTEAQWQAGLCSTREDRRISQIFAAVSSAVLLSRAREPASYGLSPSDRRDSTDQRTMMGRLLVYLSGFVGVPVPAVYAPPDAPGEIDLIMLQEDGKAVPALVMGRDVAVGRSDSQLAFFLTKRLAGLRADRCLLWPRMVSTKTELRAIFGAAMRLVRPNFELQGADRSAVRQYVAYLRKTLPSTHMGPIATAVETLLGSTGFVDLDGWIAGVEETSHRAGLLACGDIMAAAREIHREARVRQSPPDEAVLALVRWGVSSDYFDLRTGLGLALISEDDATRVTRMDRMS
jgi:tetratricopeptide (TPR) repeat protein